MIDAKEFWKYLQKKRFTFFAGVPCSIFKEALDSIGQHKGIKYIPAVREDIALGVCSGACLAGENSGIFIQNSGLGHIINALTSFNLIYKIPLLLFISWRGYKGEDAPEHIIMGKKTTILLKELGIPHKVLSNSFKDDIDWAQTLMHKKSIPVALIVKKDSFR